VFRYGFGADQAQIGLLERQIEELIGLYRVAIVRAMFAAKAAIISINTTRFQRETAFIWAAKAYRLIRTASKCLGMV
jgi:hypothetical protein